MDAAVLHDVAARGQRGPITPDHFGAAPAEGPEIAAEQRVGASALNDDAGAREPADGAARHEAILTILEPEAVVPGQVEHQPFQAEMAGVLRDDHRRSQHPDLDGGRRGVGGREQVEDAAVAVHVPFAGPVDFLEQVEGVIGDALLGGQRRRRNRQAPPW